MKNFPINSECDPDLTDKDYILLREENFIPSELSKLEQTCQRAQGTFELASRIGESDLIRGIYVRASLGELVSMEETLKVDMPDLQPLKINSIRNTLLHLLRELRNFHFHLTNAKFSFNEQESHLISETDSSYNYGPFISQILIIDNLDEIRQLKNIQKYYTDNEVDHMIQWMKSAQTHYSLQSLILKGLKFYSQEIVTYYNLTM